MLSEMSPVELGEWMAEYSLSPWGEWRADWRVGQLTALTAEINRNRDKRPDSYVTKDFMFDYLVQANEAQALANRLRATLLTMGSSKKAK